MTAPCRHTRSLGLDSRRGPSRLLVSYSAELARVGQCLELVRLEFTTAKPSPYAHDQSIGSQTAARAAALQQGAGARTLCPAARRVLAGEDDDAEEAQFGAAEDHPRAAFQRQGSHRLYSRRRARVAGTLDRLGARGA